MPALHLLPHTCLLDAIKTASVVPFPNLSNACGSDTFLDLFWGGGEVMCQKSIQVSEDRVTCVHAYTWEGRTIQVLSCLEKNGGGTVNCSCSYFKTHQLIGSESPQLYADTCKVFTNFSHCGPTADGGQVHL